MYIVLAGGDADPRPDRGGADPHAAGPRHQRAGPGGAEPLRSALLHPRQHHDLLHGDAVPDRADQLRRAAADRRAGHGVSLSQFRRPLADRGRRRVDDGLPGGGRILHRRLERLPALYRAVVQRRPGTGLLDLGGDAVLDRQHHGRHQRRLHDLQAPRARHDLDAHAAVLLDVALHRHPDDLRHAAAHRWRRCCWPPTATPGCISSPTISAAT